VVKVVDFHVIQVVMEVQEVVELTPVQELEQEIHLQLVLLKVITELRELMLHLIIEVVVEEEPVRPELKELHQQ
jgi:hypothetical protein